MNKKSDNIFLTLLGLPGGVVKLWLKEVKTIPTTKTWWDNYKIGNLKIGRIFGLGVLYLAAILQVLFVAIVLLFLVGYILK